jgi:2-polyprenyl-3-methyl-5-hydroxy-6-metoxy-1,4-benzoquinol methylase
MSTEAHDRNLSEAFDSQASLFERAPVQTDPQALQRLVEAAGFAPGSRILDAGCGPGLVSEAFLKAGCSIVGVDLSAEMIERARRRCAAFGDRATFIQTSLFDESLDRLAPFDGAISRYVVHHVVDPSAFLARQVALVRPGGAVVVSDHITDPDPGRADHHRAVERDRDVTHTTNLTAGQLVDLLAAAGLSRIRLEEDEFTLDFDEWFNRGTPGVSKDEARTRILAGPAARGYLAIANGDRSITIHCVRAIVRGERR